MPQFVYIKAYDGEHIANEEIIRTENLLKIVKWHDGDEDKIVFEVWDPTKSIKRRFRCKCSSPAHRDTVFNWYNSYLCEGIEKGI